jgi:2-polyprenyl-3-methyl-5-hydroxy-6-metoxy-1,4-benzoquinol methylase
LNVGGAPYLFEALAQKSNLLHKVTTIDLQPLRHLHVIKLLNLDVQKVDIEDVEQRKGLILHDFDVILLCELLEHMRIDLIGTLKFLREGMRDDAILYLTTPNFYFFVLSRVHCSGSVPDQIWFLNGENSKG